MWNFLKDVLWHADDAPDEINWFGAAILVAFLLFCGGVLWLKTISG